MLLRTGRSRSCILLSLDWRGLYSSTRRITIPFEQLLVYGSQTRLALSIATGVNLIDDQI